MIDPEKPHTKMNHKQEIILDCLSTHFNRLLKEKGNKKRVKFVDYQTFLIENPESLVDYFPRRRWSKRDKTGNGGC